MTLSFTPSDFDQGNHTFRSPKFQSVVNDAIDFFAGTPIHLLPPPSRFHGPGVYGLYYVGDYELYKPLAKLNANSCILPIYVGKAVAPGWRKGRSTGSETAETSDLYKRLREHAGTVQQAPSLKIADFRCRFMVMSGVEGDLVVPVEAALIRKYRPLWNGVVDGFGNHDPGKGRYAQMNNEWDVLHPGRSWASKLTGGSTPVETIVQKIQLYMTQLPLP